MSHSGFSSNNKRTPTSFAALSPDSGYNPANTSVKDVILFTVDKEGICRAGLPPAAYLDDYTDRAVELGKLSNLSHVVFCPDGNMYAVKGHEMYTGPMPSNPSKNWLQDTGKRVGKTDWDRFNRLFFHPNGTLYAVTREGALYKGPPPTNENVTWLYTEATKIGLDGWNIFEVLFFDPQGILHGVTNDKFVKKSPPMSTDVKWFDTSETIGKGSEWSDLSHWMSFSPDGKLWCVSKREGHIYSASPPTKEDNNWIGRAQHLGYHYNFPFMAFTRDRTVKSFVTFDFQPDVGKILSTVPEVVAEQAYDNRHSTSPLNSVSKM